MAKDPAYIRYFKNFTKSELTVKDLPLLEAELYGESDRATAVMASSVLETTLESFLRSKIRPSMTSEDLQHLFDFSGSLGTFSSRCLLGYAFQFYGPETRDDLNLVRLIRNAYAHCRRSFLFTEPTLREVCKHLKTPDSPGAFIPASYLRLVPDDRQKEASDMQHPKTRYLSTCYTLSERLLQNRGHASGPNVPDLR